MSDRGLQSRLLGLKCRRPGFRGAGSRVLGGIPRPSSAVGRRPASSQTQALPSTNGEQPASGGRPSCPRAGGGAAAPPGAGGEQRREPQVTAPRLLRQIPPSWSPGPPGREGRGRGRRGRGLAEETEAGSVPEVPWVPSNRLWSRESLTQFSWMGEQGVPNYEHLGERAATPEPGGLREEVAGVQEI